MIDIKDKNTTDLFENKKVGRPKTNPLSKKEQNRINVAKNRAKNKVKNKLERKELLNVQIDSVLKSVLKKACKKEEINIARMIEKLIHENL